MVFIGSNPLHVVKKESRHTLKKWSQLWSASAQ
jgi:hypothetical protein